MKFLAIHALSLVMLFSSVARAQPMYGDVRQEYCREYTQTVLIGGMRHKSYGTACMQPDGSWKMAAAEPIPQDQPVRYISPPQFVSAPRYVTPPPYYVAQQPIYYAQPYPYPYYAPVGISVGFGHDWYHSGYHGNGYGYGHGWHH